jgi:ubiquinone/menaquinone biosynthesis C-methylase UbiE
MKAKLSRAFRLAITVAAIAPLAAQERSDINAQYLDPDLDVEVWVERFEVEGREAYDFREEITASLGLRRGESVADIGAGTGLFEPLLAADVGPRGKVYAVDISPKFIEHIAKNAAARGLDQIEARLGTVTSIGLPEGSVDVVFICDAYHHFEDYDSMLQSIHSALKPGGRLVVVDYDRVEGESSEFVLEHIRASKQEFTSEIEARGFRFVADRTPVGMVESFVRRFERP